MPNDPARRAAFHKMLASVLLAVIAAATITVGQPAFAPAVTAALGSA